MPDTMVHATFHRACPTTGRGLRRASGDLPGFFGSIIPRRCPRISGVPYRNLWAEKTEQVTSILRCGATKLPLNTWP